MNLDSIEEQLRYYYDNHSIKPTTMHIRVNHKVQFSVLLNNNIENCFNNIFREKRKVKKNRQFMRLVKEDIFKWQYEVFSSYEKYESQLKK